MEDGVVHEEYDVPLGHLLVRPYMLQHLEQVLLEERRIIRSFHDLGTQQLVLRDGSNEGHRVHLLLDSTPLH